MFQNLDKEWRERVVKNNLDLIILRLLRTKPLWGYEVNGAIRDRFQVYLSAGTLYPLLHSLEEDGYIQGEWDSERGRGRRIYKITDGGIGFLESGERATLELARLIQTQGKRD
ncbi:MAG: PadR family transcriptional regulator [Candidatus Bathyarchaeia archaeon]